MSSPLPPSITLTDPHNLAAEPSPVSSPISPVKTVSTADSIASFELNYASSSQQRYPPPRDRNGNAIGSGRPGSAAGRSGSVVSVRGQRRPETSSGRSSPGKLLRTAAAVNTGSPSRGSVSPSRQQLHGVRQQEAHSPAPLDPLSQQILQRTNGAQTLYPTSTSLRPMTSDSASVSEDARSQYTVSSAQTPLSRTDTETSVQGLAQKDLKKGVKAVSFLSRLIGSKKKDSAAQESALQDDNGSQVGDRRPEGAEVKVFAQPMVDNMGFSPRHPQPPAYIKVRSKYKPRRDFDRLFLAQELRCSKRRKLARTDSNKLRRKSSASPDQDTVWAMEFSKDGKYLAAAGADMVVRVWQVLSSPEDRHKHEAQESDGSSNDSNHMEHLSAPVFQSKPIREYEGHGATILDLSWSKNNFLLSSSMDKTVRLWHVSRDECLCTFKHHDFVPSIAFHPKDDRFFLAGSLDSRLRLWSISDKAVAFSAQVPEMITAVAFTPDGKSAMAGCLNGLCMFYDTEGLKYQTQIQVRSTRGQNARGSKITGIQTHTGPNGDTKVLITSNDSRVRLYNFRDKSLELKFKGNANNSSQIRATLSDDGRYVVCGSEDRKAYIWSVKGSDAEGNDKRPLECFETHETVTTAVCFAPSKTRTLLGKSEDPVYDVCNPPPVTLLSSAERAGSQTSSRPPTESGSALNTPADPDKGFVRPRESASYLARVSHKEGNIIVTADYTGMIKVFRQDCAWNKRRIDDWDRGSIFGGKRGGRGSRTASVTTKASQLSLRDARTSPTSQVAPSDRILSWRQGIASTSNITSNARESNTGTSRSISPRKSLGQASTRTESNVRSATATTEEDSATSTAPTSLDVNNRSSVPEQGHAKKDSGTAPARNDSTPKPDPSDGQADVDRITQRLRQRRLDDPLLLGENGRSIIFWDPTRWKERHERASKMHSEDDVPLDKVPTRDGHLSVRPMLSTVESYVSKLSDERSANSDEEGEAEEFEEARETFSPVRLHR